MTLSFGTFTFHADRRQLLRDGIEVRLAPKAFDLLRLLLERAPAVVPKEEIHARLWPDTFVSEATLLGLIKEVRRALNDEHQGTLVRDDGGPRLRTVHPDTVLPRLPLRARFRELRRPGAGRTHLRRAAPRDHADAPAVPDVALHYTTFGAIARDIDDARIFGGIHFRFDQEAGARQGRQVGTFVYRHHLRRLDGFHVDRHEETAGDDEGDDKEDR